MADNPAVSVPQMNQETILAQEDLRDEAVAGHSDPGADHRHETREADVVRIAWIGAGMAAAGILMHIGLWLLLNFFKRLPTVPEFPMSPLAQNPPTPVAPRIQDANPQNYQRFLHREEHTLNGSGPVPPEESEWQREPGTKAGSRGIVASQSSSGLQANGEKTNLYNPGPGVLGPKGVQEAEGTTHISIEQAKTLLLQSGLPTRPQKEMPPVPQQAADVGSGKPESLPLGMQPNGTYRADVGPMGKNP